MPYAQPTLTTLQAEALQDIQDGELSGIDALLPNAVLRVLALVMAGFAYLHYKYQDYTAQQSTPWTATHEWAEGWGAAKGVTRKDAIAARYLAAFTGTPSVAVLPAGTVVTRKDGFHYTCDTEVTADMFGKVAATITATMPGGAGTMLPGTALVLFSPVEGVNAASGASGPAITPGADQETSDAFKTRYLQVYAAPPQGGDESDYAEWALAVPGVTRAWVKSLGMGAGTVVVYSMWDLAEAANAGFPVGTDGVATDEARDTPATGDQLTLADALYPIRPATALVYSVAPTPYLVAFTIKTQTAVTTAIRAQVNAAIDTVFLALADALGGMLDSSPFETAIAAITGMPRFTLTAPAGEFGAALGSLPVRGTVSYA